VGIADRAIQQSRRLEKEMFLQEQGLMAAPVGRSAAVNPSLTPMSANIDREDSPNAVRTAELQSMNDEDYRKVVAKALAIGRSGSNAPISSEHKSVEESAAGIAAAQGSSDQVDGVYWPGVNDPERIQVGGLGDRKASNSRPYIKISQVGDLRTALTDCIVQGCPDERQMQIVNTFMAVAEMQGNVAPIDASSYARWKSQLDSIPERVDLGINSPAAIAASKYFSDINKAVQPSYGLLLLMLLGDSNIGGAGGNPAKGFALSGVLNSGISLLSTPLQPGSATINSLELKPLTSIEFGESKVPVYEGQSEALVVLNKKLGINREKLTGFELSRQYPAASVQAEQFLRTSEGLIAVDPLTNTGRRIDHIVIQDNIAIDSVETTSLTAKKAAQIAKENRIRQSGGTFVRDRDTGQLVDLRNTPTRIIRRK
jgi:hypothetical protein